MKQKILEELWHGDITPQTKQFNRGTRYDQALKMMCKNEEKLNVLLAEKEQGSLKISGLPERNNVNHGMRNLYQRVSIRR